MVMTNAPVLRVDDISKAFGGLQVLNGVSFDVAEQSITGLIGANGSGKSTIFDIITGFQRVDSGAIYAQGRDITTLPPHEVSRLGVVRTFQLTRIFQKLTVLENMLIGARGEDSLEQAGELLELIGLQQLAHNEAQGLSFGQQKLLELAMVLGLNPSLLMLDEPMAGVNPALGEELVEHILNLRESGKTVLLIEHDIPVVSRICDNIIVLDAGQVIAQGTADEVLEDVQVKEAFLGA